ncbi:MAG: carbohydrate-binding family 9-like protein [Muribaculaceae bacterium]|nr:carbohydrate-binding family 9-like protein [Muribaculaceae bacterium]
MKNKNTKSLIVTRIDQLDNLELENISDFMEQNVAKNSLECRNWGEEFPYHPLTVFSIAYSSKYIYIDFFVRCNYLRAMNYTNNSPVSEDSCVEFFLSTPGSKEYWNFEFNCIGTINASHRETRENPTRLNDSQLASIKRYASCGTRPFEEMEGLFAWNLAFAIPLELIGLKAESAPIQIKGNFYKCGSKTSSPHFLSWSPIQTEHPSFHCPEFFGDITLT